MFIDDHGDYSPLHHACGSPNVVLALLNAGADVNVRDGVGATPMHYAVGGLDLATIRLLLNAGAAKDSEDYGGETPLDIAMEKKHETPRGRAVRRQLGIPAE